MASSSGKKIIALLNLAFSLVLHFLRRLCFWKKTGLKQFDENYRQDGLLPLTSQDQKILFSFSACINCRLCDTACPAIFKIPRERFPGPSFVLTTYSRSFKNLWASSLDLSLCQDCAACHQVCPNNIDVKGAIGFVQRKVAEQIQYASTLD